ncbi:MAG: cytochrome c3 family protein [Anaerolineae bacterium]|nr:cytochrome c3 family protein [Anaerolineae bacterium]
MLGIGLILLGCGLGLLPRALAQEQPGTDVTPAPRITSVFDRPAQAQPAAQPTTAPSATEPSDAASASPAPQVTRYTSIFDNPAATSAPAQVPAASTAVPGQPTRVPSIFDTQATQAPAPGGQAAPTPYQSLLDAVQADVIRFEGEEPPDAEYCLGCHESPYLQMTLASGEVISVTVDGEAYRESVHGQHGTEGYKCIRCHTDMNEYPHEEVTAQTARELTIDFSNSCARCHPASFDETADDTHVALMANGNTNAAVCADCHSGHEVERLTDPLTGVSLPESAAASASMCGQCHSEIYNQYTTGVHGSAVLEGNPDAPACADCHGVHSTEGPSTASFRLFSPQICAKCHADETMMAEYDISTNVFDTYVADFHGTTVAIFQNTAPDQPFNVPVCVDCHGAHNTIGASNASSPGMKENLLTVCQRCHPDATTNFPDAWMSHYPPNFQRTPLVALANLAYTVAIPAVVGGLGLFVVTDIRRRRTNGRKDQ